MPRSSGASYRAALAFFALLSSVTIAALPGCKTEEAAAPVCDDAKCAPGNKCLPLDGEIKCRKTCDSNFAGTHGDNVAFVTCPFNYTCVTQPDGNSFCLEDFGKVEKKDKGQWGFACNPANGSDNPDCDTSQDFYCYGESPTDGNAYCTRYACETDRDCAAKFWCATVNVGPSADSSRRTVGAAATQRVCLRREYCAACNSNMDCPPLDGVPQYCVPDDAGRNFCAPECESSTTCAEFGASRCVDAGATDIDGNPHKTCYQRSGVCIGDGSLCSSCLSDADCGDDGACVRGQYSREKSCAKKAPEDCKSGESQGGCVEKLDAPKVAIRCLGGLLDEAPKNYCHGVYPLGESGDVGCWTPAR